MTVKNQSTFQLFLQNCRLLSDTFNLEPLLYGSAGLEYITGDDLQPGDIDILIPGSFIGERWPEFKTVLEAAGYLLIDEHEHTFSCNGTSYSYAAVEELADFAGINLEDIQIREVDTLRFRLLSLEQYLQVYRKSIQDGYRIRVRQKKDAHKILLIESKLSKQ